MLYSENRVKLKKYRIQKLNAALNLIFHTKYSFKKFSLNLNLFIISVIQFYVLILVRSEVIKLERNTNFEFVNHATDPDTLKVDIKNMEGLGY